MDSAPKDGTEIIVIETPNGEHFNVMVACWMAWMTASDQNKWHEKDNTSRANWWGTYPTHWSNNGPHHTHWKPIAMGTPLCWKPMPKMNLSRRTLEKLMAAQQGDDNG
jgi:hypothetical protein